MSEQKRRKLASHTVREVVELKQSKPDGQKGIISLRADTTLGEALDVFRKHNLIAAPVEDEHGVLTGIFNLFDAVCAVCLPLSNPQDFSLLIEKPDHQVSLSWFTQRLTQELFQTPVQDILGVSTESRTLITINAQDTLEVLVEAFTQGKHHHLLVSLGGGALEFLSQTDLMYFLAHNRESFQQLLQTDVAEVLRSRVPIKTTENPQAGGVVCAEVNGSALSAFRVMYKTESEVRAVALLNGEGKLVESLSVSDLRGLSPYTVASLLLPCTDFLKLFPGSRSLVTCTEDDTLATVVALLAESRVHRVWVSDPKHCVKGVITMTDIIRAVC